MLLKSSYGKCIEPIYNQMDLIKTSEFRDSHLSKKKKKSEFRDSLLIMEQKVNPIHVNKCNLDLA
jgi:hypothetical protein